MFALNIDQYKFFLQSGELPQFYQEFYKDNAHYTEEIDLDLIKEDPDGSNIGFIAVQEKQKHREYVIVIAVGYDPSEPVFHPEILFIPEEKTLFVGAGEKVHIYALDEPGKIFEGEAHTGFLSWDRIDNYVIMSAEMGIAAFETTGKQLWSQFLLPPWEYSVKDAVMNLVVGENTFTFPITAGPHITHM